MNVTRGDVEDMYTILRTLLANDNNNNNNKNPKTKSKSNSMRFALYFRFSCNNIVSTFFICMQRLSTRCETTHYANTHTHKPKKISTNAQHLQAGSLKSLEICWIDYSDVWSRISLLFLHPPPHHCPSIIWNFDFCTITYKTLYYIYMSHWACAAHPSKQFGIHINISREHIHILCTQSTQLFQLIYKLFSVIVFCIFCMMHGGKSRNKMSFILHCNRLNTALHIHHTFVSSYAQHNSLMDWERWVSAKYCARSSKNILRLHKSLRDSIRLS